MFGTIAGAGIPPSAALSPGIPSSATGPHAPPPHSGCRHPNASHPGSAWTAGTGAGFSATLAPITAIPTTAAAAAVIATREFMEQIVPGPPAVHMKIRNSVEYANGDLLFDG